MHHLISGDWLTPRRVRAYAWMMLALVMGLLATLVITAEGGLDFQGRPLGTDFSNVWTAGKLALDGRSMDAYIPRLHHLSQQAEFGRADLPFYGWHYPPFFLGVAAVLALLPYGWALVAWMVVTFSAYVAVVRTTLVHPLTILVASAYPAVAVNVLHGQNGFISAALLGGGLLALDRRPVLAGLAFGLLAYKPHLGLLLPLVLAATGRWVVFATATATVVGLAVMASAAFGFEIWSAFIESTTFTREAVLESGAIGWEKLQSVFAALSALGVPSGWAYTAQAMVAVAVAGITVAVWRSTAALALKCALLGVAALLVSPYALDYDMMIISISIVWMAGHGMKHGFLGWEKTVLAAAWAVPLFSRPLAAVTLVPLGLMVMVALFAVIARRAHHDVSLQRQ